MVTINVGVCIHQVVELAGGEGSQLAGEGVTTSRWRGRN